MKCRDKNYILHIPSPYSKDPIRQFYINSANGILAERSIKLPLEMNAVFYAIKTVCRKY